MISHRRIFRSVLLALLVLLCAGVASATGVSFTGTFSQDDDMQIVHFNVQTATTVTIETWSFGGSSLAPGGTNAAGNVIPAGGFPTVLSLFDDSTGQLDLSDAGGNASCAYCAQDPATGATSDAYISALLSAGTYLLVVTENDNTAIGPYFVDGFQHSGQGNFTSQYGASGPFLWPFQDLEGNFVYRSGNWAVDITGASPEGTTPEPASLALVVSGLVLFFAPRLSGSRRNPKI